MKKITKAALLAGLKEILKRKETRNNDREIDHMEADALLLQYIGDPEVSKVFSDIGKWYS